MTTLKGNDRSSGYERNANDWYVEPRSCVDALFDAIPRLGDDGIHDPCCGLGTIPDTAIARGWKATGGDIVDRAAGRFRLGDYLHDGAIYPNIVTNPPFLLSVPIIEHALKHTRDGGLIAIVAQAKFLYSQGRYPLFSRPECERVLILSKRPSMPPGELLVAQGEACRGGGSMDYCWVVFRSGKAKPGATIEWLL